MRYKFLLIILFISACTNSSTISPGIVTEETSLPLAYEYQIGLGYGFLGKEVVVLVNGDEIMTLIGTEEIEQFAQLLGTKMLVSGASSSEVLVVGVMVDGGELFEQKIDLNEGRFVHIYLEETELLVFNTAYLILE